jgi:hypothetical protein
MKKLKNNEIKIIIITISQIISNKISTNQNNKNQIW